MEEADLSPNSEPYFFYHASHPFSNHYWRTFTVNGLVFPHLESFLMYCKARLFRDFDMADLIAHEADPQRCKLLGRKVHGYDEEIWAGKREEYHVTGGIRKFSQNPDLRDMLVATYPRELVEASPTDRLWGIGMSANDARILQRELWGRNLCGKGLMQMRQYFVKP